MDTMGKELMSGSLQVDGGGKGSVSTGVHQRPTRIQDRDSDQQIGQRGQDREKRVQREAYGGNMVKLGLLSVDYGVGVWSDLRI